MSEIPIFHNDCLDDVTPSKGFPWRRFNQITRRIRADAVAAGRPVPGRQHVMDAMLRQFEAEARPGVYERLSADSIENREVADQKRRGTRTRALEAKYRMGWR